MLTPSSDFFKRLLDHLNTAVLLIDEQLKVSYLNPSAEMLLAVSRQRAVGYPLENIFIDYFGDDAMKKMAYTLKTAHPFTKREAHMRVGTTEVVVDYTVAALLTPHEPPCLLIEMQQIDRLLRISREESILSNHQVTKQLVRGVAHEIKNPLGGIRGAAQLLGRALPDNHLSEYTQIIIEEADRLRNLADRMLGPRKLPDLQPVNIHECLERVRSLILVEAEGEVTIVRDYDLSLPELTADPDQLIQALLNITGNALQALRENPKQIRPPTITLRTRAQRQFTIGAVRHRLVVRIDIVDNGPGIPANLVDTIFYPMVTGRASGSGLGLSIAQDIIHLYHGLIECDSRVGQTIFSIFLPLENGHDNSR
ncbi:nitrogen regulation protein NR(II) [Agitococcus lubricus]|uniref:Sensory histidine kinase/phosphatase NtrB n=1 Tax=Agitococcus lubricus TaxID=1077255 RepID=A0A2T5IZJ8_9GAMM|nr:nitrogen regulation protein NR(II) [Agitococcus lubricus]PTQ89510.1 PAS/PAC sensor signal transduction histidine kinase [Agitococcus lubricus]